MKECHINDTQERGDWGALRDSEVDQGWYEQAPFEEEAPGVVHVSQPILPPSLTVVQHNRDDSNSILISLVL